MCMSGEDVEEKALQLSGTDVGGWTVIVKPAPLQKELRDPQQTRKATKPHRVRVTGYDTSLPEIDIQMALCNHFSSCGEVTQVLVLPSGSASVFFQGEKYLVKALKLTGSNMGGMNLVVEPNLPRPEDIIIKRQRLST
ncbi:hypothetical protein CARUB_v10003104mg, partial [Capsella rubella]